METNLLPLPITKTNLQGIHAEGNASLPRIIKHKLSHGALEIITMFDLALDEEAAHAQPPAA